MTEAAPGARYAALAVSSRRRLLEVLQSAEEPLDVGQLAAAVGLGLHLWSDEPAVFVREALPGRSLAPPKPPRMTSRPGYSLVSSRD